MEKYVNACRLILVCNSTSKALPSYFTRSSPFENPTAPTRTSIPPNSQHVQILSLSFYTFSLYRRSSIQFAPAASPYACPLPRTQRYTISPRIRTCASSASFFIFFPSFFFFSSSPSHRRQFFVQSVLPAPQIVDVLNKVARQEGISLPEELALRVAQLSERNLRRAILMLEATKVRQYAATPPLLDVIAHAQPDLSLLPHIRSPVPHTRSHSLTSSLYLYRSEFYIPQSSLTGVRRYPFQPNQRIEVADWENFILALSNEIIAEQSPKWYLPYSSAFFGVVFLEYFPPSFDHVRAA